MDWVKGWFHTDCQYRCAYRGQCIDSQKFNISIHILKAVCSFPHHDRLIEIVTWGLFLFMILNRDWTFYDELFINLQRRLRCFKYNLEIVHPKIKIMSSVLMQNTKDVFELFLSIHWNYILISLKTGVLLNIFLGNHCIFSGFFLKFKRKAFIWNGNILSHTII